MRRLSTLRATVADVALARVQRLAAHLRTLVSTHEAAQGLVEYGLILVLIAVVCIGILTLMGQTVSGVWYQRVLDRINDIVQ